MLLLGCPDIPSAGFGGSDSTSEQVLFGVPCATPPERVLTGYPLYVRV